MELQYDLTVDDLVAFNKHHIWHSPTCRRSYYWNLIGGIVTGLLVAILIGVFYGTPEWTLLYCAILVPLCWLFWRVYYRVAMARRLRKLYREGENRGLAGAHVLITDDEGFTSKGQMGEGKLKWAVVERTVEDKDYLYVYISAVSALIIPKRAFRDEQHMRAFLDEARRLKAEADEAQAGRERAASASR
jgi:hypothetical protein